MVKQIRILLTSFLLFAFLFSHCDKLFEEEEDQYGRNSIYIVDTDGSNLTRLTDDEADDYAPRFSNDGSKIIFYSRGSKNGYFIINIDGTGLTEYDAIHRQAEGDSLIVYEKDGDIYKENILTKEVVNLTNSENFEEYPHFSPYYSKILFYTMNYDESIGIMTLGRYLMDRDGSNIIKLSEDEEWSYVDNFSPDESKIVFLSRDINDYQSIWIIDIDGNNKRKLGDTFQTHTINFSPDDSNIIFDAFSGDNHEIFCININSCEKIKLTNDPNNDTYPFYSPDGEKIVFISDRDGKRNIFIMNANGANQKNLTTQVIVESDPQFSPDSKKIVFTGLEN